VVIDPKLYRPADVDLLLADASKAREKLGWQPTLGFAAMIRQMVDAELRQLGEEPARGDAAA
jgi:GDPmannose 4,6-dehydratase